MRTNTWQKMQDVERAERENATTPAEKRKVYKRQWARRYRERWKQKYRPDNGVVVYFPKKVMARIQAFRRKGMMTSTVVIDMVVIGMDFLDRARAKQAVEGKGGQS